MKLKFTKRLLSLALVFVLSINLLTAYSAEVKPNIKATIAMSKTSDKLEVNKNEAITLSYEFTPARIAIGDLQQVGNNDAKEIVIIMDKSGSMAWDILGDEIKGNSQVKSRMTLAKESAVSFVNKVKSVDNVKVALVAYGTSAYAYQSSKKDEWFSLNDAGHYADLIGKIRAVTPEGGTNIGDAIRIGKDILADGETNAKKYFIILTDGTPTAFSYRTSLRTSYTGSQGVKGYNYIGGSTHYVSTIDEAPEYYIDEYKHNKNDHNKYFANAGSADMGGYAFAYAKLMSKELTASSQNYFIAFADKDAGNKLESIAAQSVDGKYSIATSSNSLIDIYNDIADDVITEVSLKNTYFEEEFSDEFEVVSTSTGLTINGQRVSGYIGNMAGNVNYKLNAAGTYFEANPVKMTVTLKAIKAGVYWSGANNSSFVRYDDIDGKEGRKYFSPTKLVVLDYNPLSDSDASPDEVKIDTDILYTGIDVDWDLSDAEGVKYYLEGDQEFDADNSQDKYFNIDQNNGKVTVRNMAILRRDLAEYGYGILEKYISIDEGNTVKYLTGNTEETLTTQVENKASVYQAQEAINLDKKTEINFEINLGSLDAEGADGIVFVINDKEFNISEHSVSAGGGLGYDKQGNIGIADLFNNSIGFEFDTWTNRNNEFISVSSIYQQDSYKDFSDDHIALVRNGGIAHMYQNVSYKSEGNKTSKTSYVLSDAGNQIAGYTGGQFTPGNLEDGKWRKGQVIWDPETDKLTLSFDLNADGVIDEKEGNLVVSTTDLRDKFPSQFAYFGFTAATGSRFNYQKVRNISVKQDNIFAMNGKIIVKAVKGEDTYYKNFDIDIVTDANAITDIVRTVNSSAGVNKAFDAVYSFAGDLVMLSSISETVPFTSVYFTEQYPAYMEIISYPAGLKKTGTLETGYRLEGELTNIVMKRDPATGLYAVDGNLIIELKATRINNYVLDQGSVIYTDPNNYSNNIIVRPNTISIRDSIKPIITVNATKGTNSGSPTFKITGMLNGTSSEIVEARYVKASGIAGNLTLAQVKSLFSSSTALVTNKSPMYVNEIQAFAGFKNKIDITFVQFTVTENGYFYIYTKDESGNEEIKLVHITNIGGYVPVLT